MARGGGWTWYVALDGGDLDGLTGAAGILKVWLGARGQLEVQHRFHAGIAGGHNVTPSPDGRYVLLGNYSQEIVVIRTTDLAVVARLPTLSIEPSDYRLRSTTHHVWLDDETFLAPVGDHLYEFHFDAAKGTVRVGARLVAHQLYNVHELRMSQDGRYVLMGDQGPEDSGARQVCIWDRVSQDVQVLRLPGTVWHVAMHPTLPIGYATTYSYSVEDEDWVRWAPAYTTEYVFQIDLERRTVSHTFAGSASFPLHLNSDVEVDEENVYVACGGSHCVVELAANGLHRGAPSTKAASRWSTNTASDWPRVYWCRTGWRDWLSPSRAWQWCRQALVNAVGSFLRKSAFQGTHLILQAYLVTGWRTFDGVYCARLTPDGEHLLVGHRGYGFIDLVERKTFKRLQRLYLPPQTLVDAPHSGEAGLHLGLHHSAMVRSLDGASGA